MDRGWVISSAIDYLSLFKSYFDNVLLEHDVLLELNG